MIFTKHYELEGKHAFLSPSNHAWLNYNDDKLIERFTAAQAIERGTQLHAFAAEAIRLKKKLENNGDTLNMYVNDCIGYRMSPEVPLYYSRNFFGTADAISYRDGLLRIFDYKSGVSHVSMDQLRCYAALFCLEYKMKPFDIGMELRIYQKGGIQYDSTGPVSDLADTVMHIMDKAVQWDKLIELQRMNSEG